MSHLRTRLLALEGRTKLGPQLGAVRVIQDGDLSKDQVRLIDTAHAEGRLAIVRFIVDLPRDANYREEVGAAGLS